MIEHDRARARVGGQENPINRMLHPGAPVPAGLLATEAGSRRRGAPRGEEGWTHTGSRARCSPRQGMTWRRKRRQRRDPSSEATLACSGETQG